MANYNHEILVNYLRDVYSMELLVRKIEDDIHSTREDIGGNPKVAKLSGVNVSKLKVIYFMVGGALSALAGVLITSRMGTAQPTLGTNWPMETIAGIVIGGTHFQGGSGSIVNSVLGVLLMTMITNGLNLLGVNTFWQSVVTALLLIITIVISTFQDRKKSLL